MDAEQVVAQAVAPYVETVGDAVDAAVNILAALRAAGYETYRPEECMETLECAHCVTASIPLEHRFENFYLVPVPDSEG